MKPADPRSAQDPLVGLVLAGCKLEGVLGRGGMGAVYRAHHVALDKAVAVKILAPHLAGDTDYVERFIQEARAAAKIDHPNVVHVLDVGHEAEQHFIIMQFVEGESLEDILDREGKLDLKRATRVARDVAAGLDALHAAGIVHRDIKPANILISRDGSVKITDFGLARNLRQQRGLTVAGVFMGTPEYVSPEQVTDENVDHRTDLYSLGVAYYQMLSGELPFSGQSPVEVASAHLNQPCPPVETRVSGLDARAVAIVGRLLEKKPEARIQTAAILKAELEEILSGAGPQARPAAAPPPEIPIRGRRVPPPPAAPAAPASAEPVLVSAGPKKRPMPEAGEIVPREFVVPPPPPKPKIASPEEGPKPATVVPPPPAMPGPVMRPKPVPAPPPPPAAKPATAQRRRRKEMGRQALFWLLIGAAWALFFAAGALGTSVRDEHSYLESLTRPFTVPDGSLLTRLGAAVLALVLLALAFFQNRRAIEDSYLPGPAIMLLIFAGLTVYAGALGLPVPAGEGGLPLRAVRGLRETWLHGVHLFPAAVWAVLTGFALGSHPSASRREYAAAGVHIAAGLAAAALFGTLGSGGSIDALTGNLARPLDAGFPGLVALGCAALAVALAFGRRRPKPVRAVGVGVGLAALAPALLAGVARQGVPSSLGDLLGAPFVSFGDDLLAHGGLLTVGALLGIWGACVLYNRFTPS